MTIAEWRGKAAHELAARKESATETDYLNAKRIMNSYYRLVGLCESKRILQNNINTADSNYTKETENREEKWFNRLNAELKEYNAELKYFCYFPTICRLGSNADLGLAKFYD